ncbi:MAG: glycosyltransferase [Candidatus Latescibacteria bacterium]|nr:glycosyltransferase [Candidatus Latescibacterota bacterium]NIO00965.1 glycosyltransferase [Candidatus Latescibacterota bacterium]NIO27364.1 glycosyltransferase [Candidatus Latescibacterota bacterium]NIO54886.1 glycosyltransferase [Candidatus Latescibacterota bacterium]NIT00975.1 glycosyltransferase [Candidatus Latescibacterota bacterium]
MSNDDKKQAIAVYLRYYLSISMTFVYRQLHGAASRFRPIVLTSSLSNLDIFPYEPIYAKEWNFFDRVQSRLERLLKRKYAALPPIHIRYWKRIVREQKVRLIHAHFGPYALEILPVARAMRIPLVATFHGFEASMLLRNPIYVAQLRELFDYAIIIAVSRGVAERLIGVGADRSRLVVHYIGAPVENFRYVERKAPSEKVKEGLPIEFLQVSNFVEKKGHRYTIEAFSKLFSRYSNCNLTLAGDGPLRGEMEALCRRMNIEDRVRFVGRVTTDQAIRLMSNADIFVHHSVISEAGDQEGLPTVIAEAMSTGLIVVSTRHSGIPEIIDHGVDGFLVEERDIEGYLSALGSALECTDAFGRRAAEKVKSKFNLDVQNGKLLEIYDRALSGQKDPIAPC